MSQETLLHATSLTYFYDLGHKRWWSTLAQFLAQNLRSKFFFFKPKKINRRDKQRGIRDVSCSIKRGEILAILGPNGAGKSTLLRLLSGCITPQSGQISIHCCDLSQQRIAAQKKIGYVADSPPLYDSMSVDEYLHFCGQLYHLSTEKLQHAIATSKQRCGLNTVGHCLIAQLSKGFQQRLAIARAILHQPEVVILDEPTTGLDPIQIAEIHDLISDLGRSHSVIISSHNLTEIQKLCHRVQVIHHGRSIYEDEMKNFKQLANLKQLSLSCLSPCDLNKLQEISGVKEIECLAAEHYLIHCETKQQSLKELALQISQLAARENWQLYQLVHMETSLETVFKHIMKTDLESQDSSQ